MKKDALESHALVGGAVGILGTAGRRKAKELRENEEVVAEGLVGIRLGLLCELGNRVRLLLLELIRQGLLLLGEPSPVFLVDLLVLGELLLELEQLGLQRRLLQVGGLLVGIDDLGSHKVIERLGAVLGDDGVDLGGIGLEDKLSVPSPPRQQPGRQPLTIFLVMLRMLLRKRISNVTKTSIPQ